MTATSREAFFFSVTAPSRTTRTGKFPATVMYATQGTNWCGRIREIRVIRPATFGQRLDASGVNKGYVYASNTTSATDSVLMEY